MKKVAFIASVAGHIESFHLPTLKMFQENGFHTYVIANDNIASSYIDKFIPMDITRSPVTVDNLKCYFKLKKIFKSEKFDIISCHTPAISVIARLAAKNMPIKVFYMAHGFHFYERGNIYKNILYHSIEKFMAHYTDVLITINLEDYRAAKLMKLRNKGSVYYVPGVGIDYKKLRQVKYIPKFRKELGIPEDAFVIISVGELNNNKNHIVILEALKQLKSESIYYLVCGKGENEFKYKKYVIENNIKNVNFMGYRNDIPDLYKISNLLIFPSYREGLPVSVMEAMAVGIPIISSNIRGCSDLIEHNKNGILISPNSVDEVINGIIKLKNPEIARQFIKNGIEKAKDYDVEIVLKKLKEIYEI